MWICGHSPLLATNENCQKAFKIRFGQRRSALVCTASALTSFIAKAPPPTTGIPHPVNSPLPFASSVEMPRHVWLCTRPLAYDIPGMDITSNPTRPYLRHWGVLVSELSVVDVRVLIQSINSPNAAREVIGTIYQLMQYNDRPDIFVDSKTTLQMIQTEWKSIHLEYVGETLSTHDMIIQEGTLPGNPMI
jgi:hypothetical protein